MEFKKWISLENHYNAKVLRDWEERCPELRNTDMRFAITEKIHGANFSIWASPDGTVKFAKRNSFLEEGESFYGYQDVMKEDKYQSLIKHLLFVAGELNTVITLYGELFGGNIQKGVWYGAEKQFRWYALFTERDKLRTCFDADTILMEYLSLKVPVHGYLLNETGMSLVELFSDKYINHRFNSYLTPEEYTEPNICEGVVIRPAHRVVTYGHDVFYIKMKNEEFKENSHKERSKIVKDIPAHIMLLQDKLLQYVNDNRTESLSSKMGTFDDIRQIGKYAKAYYDDVMEDFVKENYTDYSKLENNEKKMLTKPLSIQIFQTLRISLGA